MSVKVDYTIKLRDFDIDDTEKAGIGARHLYDLDQLNIEVPPSIFITSRCFDEFISHNGLEGLITESLLEVDIDDHKSLQKTEEKIFEAITGGELPETVKVKISRAYKHLSGFDDTYVSLYASAPNESLDAAAYGAKPAAVTNIRGEEEIYTHIKEIWASLFTAKGIFYREAKRYSGILTMGVVMQKVLFAEASGVAFTVEPVTEDKSKVAVEAILGLPEPLADKSIDPDVYLFDKKKDRVIEKHILNQAWMMIKRGRTKGGEAPDVKVKVSDTWKKSQKLSDKHIKYIADLAQMIEKYADGPFEISWILETGKVYVTQVSKLTMMSIGEKDWQVAPTVTALKAKLGDPSSEMEKKDETPEEFYNAPLRRVERIPTVTKVYAHVKTEEDVEPLALNPFDGVADFDPIYFKSKEVDSFLETAAKYMGSDPVVVKLQSGITDKATAQSEMRHIKTLRNKKMLKNIWISLPGSLDKDGIVDAKKVMTTIGFKRNSTFKIFARIVSPADAMNAPEYVGVGLDGVIIDYRMLVGLLTGKKGEEITGKELLREKAVKSVLEDMIKKVHDMGAETIVIFDDLVLDKETVTELVSVGTAGISTNMKDIKELKELLHEVEAERIVNSN